MSNVIKAESPLVQANTSVASITERELLGYINLRGVIGKGRTAFCKAIKKVTGLVVPGNVNDLVKSEEFTLYRLGPDECLLLTEPDAQTEVVTALQDALDGVFSSVTDVSSGYCLLAVVGDYAPVLLAKGCPIDLHPEVFTVGQSAQTLIAQAGVLISPMDDGAGFELIVRRSYADYLQRWLTQLNNGY